MVCACVRAYVRVCAQWSFFTTCPGCTPASYPVAATARQEMDDWMMMVL